MANSPRQDLYLEISRNLVEQELTDLRHYVGGAKILPAGLVEKANIQQICTQLEKEQKLKPGDLSLLADLLRGIGRHDYAEKAEKIAEKERQELDEKPKSTASWRRQPIALTASCLKRKRSKSEEMPSPMLMAISETPRTADSHNPLSEEHTQNPILLASLKRKLANEDLSIEERSKIWKLKKELEEIELDAVYKHGEKEVKSLKEAQTFLSPESLEAKYDEIQAKVEEERAIVVRVYKGCLILFLDFETKSDFEHFWGSYTSGRLSDTLSRVLTTEKIKRVDNGDQLVHVVRTVVLKEDYKAWRNFFRTGLDRTTSADNLPPPARHVERSSLSGLDLAMVPKEEQACADGTGDIDSTLQLTVREVQTALHTCRIKQEKVHLQTMQGHLETAQQGTDALMREVKLLKEKNDKAENILPEQKVEMNEKIQNLQETNKKLETRIEELLTAKQPVESGSQQKHSGTAHTTSFYPLNLPPPSRQVEHSSQQGQVQAVVKDRFPATHGQRILQEFFSCSICQKPYRNPKILSCRHSFCQECLEVRHEQWIETCDRAERPDQFRCPDCDHPVTLPTEGIIGLPTNHPTAKLSAEFYKEISLTPVDASNLNRCGFHPNEEITFYCLQCKVPICGECLRDAHSGHKVKGVDQVAKQIKENIMTELDAGRRKMEAISSFLQEIQQLQKKLMDNMVQSHKEIINAYEEQVKKIQDQRDKLLATVERSFLKNMAALEEQKDQVMTQAVELSRVCERTEQRMEQEQVVWLSQDLNLAQTLNEKLKSTETEICETSLCTFEADLVTGALPELGEVKSQPVGSNVRQAWRRKVRFGGKGSARRTFYSPTGVAVSQDNEVYIADRHNKRIQVFSVDGAYIRQFTTTLPGGQTLTDDVPTDVARDKNGNLWVVSRTTLVRYSREGTCLGKTDLPAISYMYLRGIALTMETQHVIVTEYDGMQNGRLRLFNQDGSLVCTYDSGHRLVQRPWRPRCVTVDGKGNILVTDTNNHCVHVLDREGNCLFKFGSEGLDESQLRMPRGICVDMMGNIIVVDCGNSCVKMFDSTGRHMCCIGYGMKDPRCVAMTPGGDVVVTDIGDETVSVWTQS